MAATPASTAPRDTEPVPLWRNRDFLLLRSGQAVSTVGSQVSSIAFPLLVLYLTGSPGQAGLIGFLNALPQLLFNLPAGVYVDRWDRKRVMILCDSGRALAMASVPIALVTAHLSIPQLDVVAFFEGSLAVFFNLAEGAALPRVVSREQLPAAYAQNEAVRRSAVMLGQPIGGLLYGLGRLIPFLLDAVSYAISVFSLLFIHTAFQGDRSDSGERSMRADLFEGIRWLWSQPFLRMSTALVAGTNLLYGANYLVVIVLARQHGATPGQIGLIFGIGGFGGLIGSLVAGWAGMRFGLARVVIGVNWLWAILWPMFALAPNVLSLGVIYALCVFAGPLWNVVLGSTFRAIVPDHLQARVDGAETVIAWGAIPLGPAFGGLLLQTMSAVSAVLVLAGLMILIAVAGTLSPAIRHAPSLGRSAQG